MPGGDSRELETAGFQNPGQTYSSDTVIGTSVANSLLLVYYVSRQNEGDIVLPRTGNFQNA